MRIISPEASRKNSPLRQKLLEDSVNRCFNKRSGISSVDSIKVRESGSSVIEMESLSGFPASKRAEAVVFNGLINAPQEITGNNFLICSQSLPDELREFSRRNIKTEDTNKNWIKNILSNFKKVIVLGEAEFADSASFMPWVPVEAIREFPIFLQGANKYNTKISVLLIHHRGPHDESLSERLRSELEMSCDIIEISKINIYDIELEAVLNADIHIHVGYSVLEQTRTLSPLDSIVNNAYTIVLVDISNKDIQVSPKVRQAANMRTSVSIVDTAKDLIDCSNKALRRLTEIKKNNLSVNPELAKFASENEKYILDCYQELMENF